METSFRLCTGRAKMLRRCRLAARFYMPYHEERYGEATWILGSNDKAGQHQSHARGLWRWQEIPIEHEKPLKKSPKNPVYGRDRLWNAIPSEAGVNIRKAKEWGWPHAEPPPMALRNSREYFPHWFERYFPSAACRLDVDSVVNEETTLVRFIVDPEMSRQEIMHYLENIYGIDDIKHVTTKNYAGTTYKNELGAIKQQPAYKVAYVRLEHPVKLELKTVKGVEDTKDE